MEALIGLKRDEDTASGKNMTYMCGGLLISWNVITIYMVTNESLSVQAERNDTTISVTTFQLFPWTM